MSNEVQKPTIPDTRSRAVEESARGLDAIAECDSILPGYQSIAERAATTMRALVKERALLRSALRDLRRWGSQCPITAEERAAHRQAGYAAFDKAREAMRRAG